MLKRIIILLNIALVFQCSNAIGKDTDSSERVKGGFRECRMFDNSEKSGLIDSNSKKLLFLKRFDEKGNEIEYLSYNKDGTRNIQKKYTFDNRNKIINEEHISFETNGDTLSHYFIISKYNDKGNIFKEITYESDRILTRTQYQYDIKEKLIESISYDCYDSISQKRSFKYDVKSNLIEWKEFDKNDSIIHKGTNLYNDKNNKIEENFFYKNILVDKIARKYNEKGKIIEEINFSKDSSMEKKVSYFYDDKGNQIEQLLQLDSHYSGYPRIINIYNDKNEKTEELFYKDEGSLDLKVIYKYDYYGNLIEIMGYYSGKLQEHYKYIYSK